VEQHDFGTPEWFEAFFGIVRKLMEGVDLTGHRFSSCEEYLNPPQELARDGKLGWHMVVADGRLHLGVGPIERADRKITADFALVKELAAIPFKNNPSGEERARNAAREAAEKGLFKVLGDKPPSAVFPSLAPLHDIVAHMTRLS
jgi:hypothetical protein